MIKSPKKSSKNIKTIPDEIKELMELEGGHNSSKKFFVNWIELLKKGEYNTCPERGKGMTKARFKNSKMRQKATELWRKTNHYLEDETIRKWVIRELEFIVQCIDAIELGIYPPLMDQWDLKHENIEVIKKIKWEESCKKCGREGDVLGNSLSPHLDKCPICGEFYCCRCMNHIHLDCSGIGYTYGGHFGHFEMKNVCVSCLENDFKGTIHKLLDISIRKRY